MRFGADLRAAFRIFRLVGHLGLGLLLTLRYRHAGADRRDEITRHWLAGVGRILNVQIERRGHAPSPSALWTANHVSWLDIPVLGSLIPGVRFLSKAEVASWPLVGWLARQAGTLFIRRGAGMAAAQEAMNTTLAQGRAVVLFPEATTTDGHQVRRFFPRLFEPAIEAEAAIQPVAIRYLDAAGDPDPAIPYIDDMTLLQSLWRIARQRAPRVRVQFCVPFRATGSRTEAARRAEQAVREALQDMGRSSR
ncbi:MAG: lysophospholipid acyltransferase family protein [Halothiobacillaceae bacterium]